jgi:hypothetical protein
MHCSRRYPRCRGKCSDRLKTCQTARTQGSRSVPMSRATSRAGQVFTIYERAAIEAELAQLKGQPAVPTVPKVSARAASQKPRSKPGPCRGPASTPVGLPSSRSWFEVLRAWSGRRVSNSRGMQTGAESVFSGDTRFVLIRVNMMACGNQPAVLMSRSIPPMRQSWPNWQSERMSMRAHWRDHSLRRR